MDIKDFSDWLYDTLVMAGMDQYYYQIMSWGWGGIDFTVKFLTMGLAIASVIAAAFEMGEVLSRNAGVPILGWATPVDPANAKSRLWSQFKNLFLGPIRFACIVFVIAQSWSWSMRLAAWSAVFATLVIASPITTRSVLYDSLYDQWTDFRADVVGLDLEFKRLKKEKKEISATEAACLLEKQQEFNRRVANIERHEPFPYQCLVEYCLRAEERRQGVDDDEPDHKGKPVTKTAESDSQRTLR
jgi:hypothetical protein